MSIRLNILYLFLIIFINYNNVVNGKLNEIYRWKQLEFDNLPDFASDPELYKETSYVPYSNLPVGVDHYKGRLFIAIPRRNVGIPATLTVIDMKSINETEKSPKLNAYPDFESNIVPHDLKPNEDRIISIYRTRIDVCGRLWFVDTGLLEYKEKIQVQRPSIWVIDLKTNKKVKRFEIPESVALLGDGFISITVDVDKNKCDDAFAYLPNMRFATLSVYSLREDKLWTIHHNTMNLEEGQGDFNIGGFQFNWADAVFSVALGPKTRDGDRVAYYHAMSSLSEYYVSTKILHNESLSTGYHNTEFKFLGARGPMYQSAMHDLDVHSGIMITTEISKNGVGCWDTHKPFASENFGVIAQDDENMIYPSDLKVDDESNIWVMTDSIPIYSYGHLDLDSYSYRIWGNNVWNAVKGTPCAQKRNHHHHHHNHDGRSCDGDHHHHHSHNYHRRTQATTNSP